MNHISKHIDETFKELFENKSDEFGMVGKRFGMLVVTERAEDSPYKKNGKTYFLRKWKSKCDCGGEAVSFENGLKSGQSCSCGCKSRDRWSALGKSKKKHGLSKSKEENAYRKMISRCLNEKDSQYVNYGGRGITVCDRWINSLEHFVSDVGFAPSKNHSIDRINVNGNYEPENVRWATWVEQERNRTNNKIIEIDGVSKCLAEWCEEYGIEYKKAWARISKCGWSAKRTFEIHD